MIGKSVHNASGLSGRLVRWHRVAETLLIVAVFFVVGGDPPPHVNEPHYLCRLKHYWNPEWCAGDLFLESADTQLVFIWSFGWVTRWLSLSATAWMGRLLAWGFLAWSWQRLSWRMVPRPYFAALSAAIFVTLSSYAHVAGEWVVGGVEAKCFAYGFVLLALAELVDQRWNRLWLLSGAATAWHPLVGGWSTIVCAGIWLIYDRQIAPLRTLLPGTVGYFFLAAWGVVPALMLTWNEPPDLVAEASRIYAFERLPHHLALLHLPTNEIVVRFIRHLSLLALMAGLQVSISRSAEVPQSAEASPGMTAFGPKSVVHFAWGAALLAFAGLIIELTLWNQPLVAARLQRYYWYRLTDFAAAMAVALQVTWMIAWGTAQRQARATALLTATLVFAGWYLASVAWVRTVRPVPPADAKIRDYAAWVEACEWVAENTPPDSLFLTPRLNQSFKWRTGRAEVVTRKDIPQDARNIVEWYRRLKEIYYENEPGSQPQLLDSLGILGTERVRELAHRFGADYALMDRGQLLSLPRVFWNEEYVVYRIEDGNAGNGR